MDQFKTGSWRLVFEFDGPGLGGVWKSREVQLGSWTMSREEDEDKNVLLVVVR